MSKVEHHFYALIAAMLDVGRTPDEIRAGLKTVLRELSPPSKRKES